jgi:hypothetical protein
MIFVEPYVQALQEEWGLEHFLAMCSVADTLICPLNRRLSTSNVHAFLCDHSLDTVDIWVSFVSSQSLWDAYMAEVGDVEGVNMRAMNELMTEAAATEAEVTSCRLSQWSAKIFGEEIVASLSLRQYLGTPCAAGNNVAATSWKWSSTVSYQQPASSSPSSLELEVDAPPLLHGLAFWTVFRSSQNESIRLSSHPVVYPETVQAFRCFDKAHAAPSALASPLTTDVTVVICKDTNDFTVSLHNEVGNITNKGES